MFKIFCRSIFDIVRSFMSQIYKQFQNVRYLYTENIGIIPILAIEIVGLSKKYVVKKVAVMTMTPNFDGWTSYLGLRPALWSSPQT